METTRVSGSLLERPKRPRTAYNYFFHNERQKLIARGNAWAQDEASGRNGKVAFADMAKIVSAKWKTIGTEDMIYYANLANQDKFRYRRQMEQYKEAKREMERLAVEEEEHDESAWNQDMEPIPFAPISIAQGRSGPTSASSSVGGSSIVDLMKQLDKESIAFLIAALK